MGSVVMWAAAATVLRTLEAGTAVVMFDTSEVDRAVGLDGVGIASNRVTRSDVARVL